MTDLIVESGKTYLDGFGKERHITTRLVEFPSAYPFEDQYGFGHTEKGYYFMDGRSFRHNLVALKPGQETTPMADKNCYTKVSKTVTIYDEDGPQFDVYLSTDGFIGLTEHWEASLATLSEIPKGVAKALAEEILKLCSE